MWAQARYDLGLSSAEFYALTPRQFHLLLDRHREALAHREMIGAFTTAAVKNYSMNPPEEWATPLDCMPSHKASAAAEPELSEEELEQVSDYNIRVAELAATLRAQANDLRV